MLYPKDANLLRTRSVLRPATAFGFVLAAIAAPPAVLARHARAPATGLRTVAYAKAAPDFAFDAGHGPQRLAALLGKPVVLNFWDTWCEPCRAELPAFARLRATYGDAVRLLTISDEPPGLARAFLAGRGLDFPVAEDPERKIFSAYSVTPIPVTLVLRADGTVTYVSVGETSWDELQDAVATALLGPPATAAP